LFPFIFLSTPETPEFRFDKSWMVGGPFSPVRVRSTRCFVQRNCERNDCEIGTEKITKLGLLQKQWIWMGGRFLFMYTRMQEDSYFQTSVKGINRALRKRDLLHFVTISLRIGSFVYAKAWQYEMCPPIVFHKCGKRGRVSLGKDSNFGKHSNSYWYPDCAACRRFWKNTSPKWIIKDLGTKNILQYRLRNCFTGPTTSYYSQKS